MTDWSRDPVFGDLAHELRLTLFAEGIGSDRPHALSSFWARAAPMERELGSIPCIRQCLDLFGKAPDAPWDRLPFHVPPDAFASIARAGPVAEALLAATRAYRAIPAPPRVMGVLNVTPDSFSDGGKFLEPAQAIDHGLELVQEGADYVDVGGESTRPGSEPVSEVEELERVIPVIRGLSGRTRVPISIDTTKSSVAEAALAAGATIVNDVSGGRFDPRILDVAARAGAGYVAMHMLGTPRNMQQDPRYEDLATEVTEFLRARCRAALEAGVERSKLWVDPGVGFGKNLSQNRGLLGSIARFRTLGLPVLIGVSRKSFVAAIEHEAGFDRSTADARLGGSLAALTVGVQHGAEILRVHDVREAKQAALVARALAPWSRSTSTG